MSSFTIERTKKTPYVNFNSESGTLEIKGCSLPGNAQEFYEPLINKIKEYINNPKAKTEITFYIEYFNTSSSKILLQILIQFEILVSIGKEVAFNWLIDPDDIDMYDAGLTYQSSVNIPTSIVHIQQ